MVDDTVWKSDKLVAKYLEGVRGAIPLAVEQLDVMLRLLATREEGIRRFLDLGCGDGILARAIFDHFPLSQGVLSDFSEPMLGAAREKLTPLVGRYSLLCQDYGHAEWSETVRLLGPFDAVVSGFSIHHQPDARKREIYQEIYDMLTPGGWFVHIEHVAPASELVHQLNEELFTENIWTLRHSHGGHDSLDEVRREFVNRPDQAANILAPVDCQCHWLREIGFVDVDCYLKIFEMAVFAGRRMQV